MTKISFDLVSPEKLIFSDEVGMIIVPGKDGDLGVLPGHSKISIFIKTWTRHGIWRR